LDVIDYNGVGRWSREAIQRRYAQYVGELRCAARELSPLEHSHGGRHWVYPVMQSVISGIEAGDPACVRIGIEFIQEDAKFPFGKILKSNTARALRRAELSGAQKAQVRRRVFSMLRAGHVPREFREYARLVRKIGFDPKDVPESAHSNVYVERFIAYFRAAAKSGT
jgi:hypothetical protein